MTEDFIREILEDFFKRSAVCKKYGLSMKDVVEGAPIPPGWTLDPQLDFYMPPTLLES